MATLFYGSISTINYGAGTASIALPDRESQIISDVPFLAAFYEMPKPGDVVAVLFEEINGQIGKGVILGKMFLQGSEPKESGKGIFYKEFTDKSGIKYNPDKKEMEISVKKISVDELVYKTLTQGG